MIKDRPIPSRVKDRIIFLDRDGTINVDAGYPSQPEGLVLIPRAGEALRLLSDKGYRLIVVTNQSGVARGYYTLEEAMVVNARLRELLLPYGVSPDGVYLCPHHTGGRVSEYSIQCDCRKPGIGLVLRAIGDLSLDPDWDDSWVIGDKPSDVEMATVLGCRGILVRTGHGSEYDKAELPEGTLRCPDIHAAALAITHSINGSHVARSCTSSDRSGSNG